MINNITIVQVRSNIELIQFVYRVYLGRYLERDFNKPMPFLVLEIADLI